MTESTLFTTGTGSAPQFDRVHIILSPRQIIMLIKQLAALLLEAHTSIQPRCSITLYGNVQEGDKRSEAVVYWKDIP
jgi:hypothetical protein